MNTLKSFFCLIVTIFVSSNPLSAAPVYASEWECPETGQLVVFYGDNHATHKTHKMAQHYEKMLAFDFIKKLDALSAKSEKFLFLCEYANNDDGLHSLNERKSEIFDGSFIRYISCFCLMTNRGDHFLSLRNNK